MGIAGGRLSRRAGPLIAHCAGTKTLRPTGVGVLQLRLRPTRDCTRAGGLTPRSTRRTLLAGTDMLDAGVNPSFVEAVGVGRRTFGGGGKLVYALREINTLQARAPKNRQMFLSVRPGCW